MVLSEQQILPLVEEGGEHLGRREIAKAILVQRSHHLIAFLSGQCPW